MSQTVLVHQRVIINVADSAIYLAKAMYRTHELSPAQINTAVREMLTGRFLGRGQKICLTNVVCCLATYISPADEKQAAQGVCFAARQQAIEDWINSEAAAGNIYIVPTPSSEQLYRDAILSGGRDGLS